jgi:hypothetical protein
MNPTDLGTLLALTEFTGDTDSNVPLWKAAIQRPQAGAFSLTLPFYGTPLWPTPACPAGSALLYDPRTVIAVVRREADIALDPYYGFDTGEVGLRTYLRGDVVVGQAKAAVLITFAELISNTDYTMGNTVYILVNPTSPDDVLRAHAEALASGPPPGPTLRQTAFDMGAEPLPGWSWPPPRYTGWERG